MIEYINWGPALLRKIVYLALPVRSESTYNFNIPLVLYWNASVFSLEICFHKKFKCNKSLIHAFGFEKLLRILKTSWTQTCDKRKDKSS